MKKHQISISELAQQIMLERKTNKIIAEVRTILRGVSQMLNENLPNVEDSILGATKKLDSAGEDVSDMDVQAALLMAAIQKGGDPSKVSPEEVEKNMPTVQEKKQTINESEGPVLLIVETISLILGNAALVEGICKVINIATGKMINPTKFESRAKQLVNLLQKVTGWPMKKMGEAVQWIIKKLGGGDATQRIGKYSVKLTLVTVLLIIGLSFFPIAGVSAIGVVISVTALVGKGFEIVQLSKGLIKAIQDSLKNQSTANLSVA